MASIGLEPGVLMAGLAGSAELFGGLALLAASVSLVIRSASLSVDLLAIKSCLPSIRPRVV